MTEEEKSAELRQDLKESLDRAHLKQLKKVNNEISYCEEDIIKYGDSNVRLNKAKQLLCHLYNIRDEENICAHYAGKSNLSIVRDTKMVKNAVQVYRKALSAYNDKYMAKG